MKLVVASTLALAAAAPRPAAACGVPDLGAYAEAIGEALKTTSKPVHTPLLLIGGGASTTEGSVASVSAGYGWGTKEEGFLAATTIERVLLGMRTDGTKTSVSATFGWYITGILAAGFDAGIEAQTSHARGLGPTTRLTLGANGISLRLTAGASFGSETRAVGAAELLLDVADLGNTL